MDTHSQTHQNGTPSVAQTEVVARPKRRRFSAAYKRSILEEADRCTQAGDIGALLRREGLYSSNLATWRRQRQHGDLEGAKPGRKPVSEQAKQVKKLQRENAQLKRKLEQAELIIEVQKKLSQLLGLTETKPGAPR
jgi:transposase-like protein